MLKKIYNVLNPTDVPIYTSELLEEFIKYNDNRKTYFKYKDLIDILINSDPERIDKNDPYYDKIKKIIRSEDYFYCSGIYTNILRCINYKSDNPNQFIRVEYVDTKPVYGSEYTTDIYVNVKLYNGFDVIIGNLFPADVSMDLFYTTKLFDFIKEVHDVRMKNKKSNDRDINYGYNRVRNEVINTFCYNINYMLKWYLERKFQIIKGEQ